MSKIIHFPLTRILVGCVVCAGTPLFFNALLKAWFGSIGIDPGLARGIRSVVFLVILLFSYVLLFRTYEKREVSELSIGRFTRDGMWGGLAGAAGALLVLAACAAAGAYQVISVEVGLSNILIGASVVLAGAALEEIVFRGVVFRIGEQWLGTNLAVALSAVLFSAAHLLNDRIGAMGILSAIAGGMVITMAFVFTKRLWAPILFHSAWNYVQVFFGTTLSGGADYAEVSVLKGRLQGPAWLTGGDFGPEASATAVAMLAVGSVLLYYRSLRRGNVIAPSWKRLYPGSVTGNAELHS